MATILITEDEASILIGVEDALIEQGYDVITARNGEQGLKFALQEKIDLLILDIMLPKISGFEVLQSLRQKNKQLPVILLTAKGQEKDKIKGFNLGADDYVTKPFSVHELLARVKVILRRTPATNGMLASYKINGICFDFKAMQAKKDSKVLEFSVRELELLRYLIEKKGEIITRTQILEMIWRYDPDTAPSTRTIDNYIVKLRQKIEKQPSKPKHIFTVHGKGYRFEG